MPLLLTIFIEFFKTGLFSIGGGLATLPFLFEMSATYGWFSTEQLTNMIAISESTPGPIGVNIATYVGYTIYSGDTGNIAYGILGGIFATLSLVMPSIIVILIIAGFLQKFKDSKLVKTVFYGLRAAVVGMLAVSLLTVVKTTFLIPDAATILASIEWVKLAVFAVIFFLVMKFKKHPILYIALGAVAGIVLNF